MQGYSTTKGFNAWFWNHNDNNVDLDEFLEKFVEAVREAEKEGIPVIFNYEYKDGEDSHGHSILATGVWEDADYYHVKLYDMNAVNENCIDGYYDELRINKDYSDFLYIDDFEHTGKSVTQLPLLNTNYTCLRYLDTKKILEAPFSNLNYDDEIYEKLNKDYETFATLSTPMSLFNSDNKSLTFDNSENSDSTIDILSGSPVYHDDGINDSVDYIIEIPNDKKYTIKSLSDNFRFELYNKKSFTNINGKKVDEVVLTDDEVTVNGNGADYEIAIAPNGDLCQLLEMKVDSDDTNYLLNDSGIEISSKSGISGFEINTVNDLDPSERKSITIDANNISISAGSTIDKVKVVATNNQNQKQEIEVDVLNKQNKDNNDKDTGKKDSDSKLAKVGSTFKHSSGIYKVIASDNKSKKVTYLKPNSKKVKSVKIPASIKINGISYQVTEISANAFKNCKKLKSVTIGANVTAIKPKAFYGCKKLKKITIKSNKLKKIGKQAFKGINAKAKFKVPKKKLKKYKKMIKKAGAPKKAKVTK